MTTFWRFGLKTIKKGLQNWRFAAKTVILTKTHGKNTRFPGDEALKTATPAAATALLSTYGFLHCGPSSECYWFLFGVSAKELLKSTRDLTTPVL